MGCQSIWINKANWIIGAIGIQVQTASFARGIAADTHAQHDIVALAPFPLAALP